MKIYISLVCEFGRPLVYYVVMKNHMFGMYLYDVDSCIYV